MAKNGATARRSRTSQPASTSTNARKPAAETPRQRFLRLGQGRMVNALHAIRLIGNLAGPGYDWAPDDLALMRNTIAETVEEAFARFTRSASAPKPEEVFRLSNVA